MGADVPGKLIAYGRRIAPILRRPGPSQRTPRPSPLFVGEGINSSVVITQRGDQRFFYVSGKSEASSALLDMRLQRMMGHLPGAGSSAPRDRCWWSDSARASRPDLSFPIPDVRSIVICELEPLIPPASDEFFGKENNHVLRDPRTRVVYDDARHYILTTPDKFDVITTDPIHPWVKGTSTLYSREYYELVKSHLNPGGVAAQWLPIYESDEETVKTELATFFSVFPNATVWSNYFHGDGYDLVLLGTRRFVRRSMSTRCSSGWTSPPIPALSASLADAGFHSAVDLLATYAGRAADSAAARVPALLSMMT